MKKIIFILGSLLFVASCGVKSDPLPPIGEENIGRGKPTYRKATKKISLPNVNGLGETGVDSDENDSRNDDKDESDE